MEPVRIGIVGCGNISGIYFHNLGSYRSTTVVACADLDLDRAKAAAEKHGVPLALSPDDLISHPDVELVVNLTIPAAHGPVAQQAVEHGKHVYNEKPLTSTRAEAAELLKRAGEKGVLVGGAPDTFLGGGIQTCRRLIDEGRIGEPLAAQAFMLCRGHESWHPAPEFYYQKGGGPMLDMGPYYVTALVNLLGPVRRVTGSVRASFPTRLITSQPKSGTIIKVETPTHLAGVMDFASGVIGEITTSFDVMHARLSPITIYGSEGTLHVPDPNGFGGDIEVRGVGDQDWTHISLAAGFNDNERGVGVLDMAYAIRNGGLARASGALAYHVLDVMLAFEDASNAGKHVDIKTKVQRPEPFAAGQYADERK